MRWCILTMFPFSLQHSIQSKVKTKLQLSLRLRMGFAASSLEGAGSEQLEGVQQPQNLKFACVVKTKFSILPETEVVPFDINPDSNSLLSVYIKKTFDMF